jgi:hypothetical protein
MDDTEGCLNLLGGSSPCSGALLGSDSIEGEGKGDIGNGEGFEEVYESIGDNMGDSVDDDMWYVGDSS